MLINIWIKTENEHPRIVTAAKMRSTLRIFPVARATNVDGVLKISRFNKSTMYKYSSEHLDMTIAWHLGRHSRCWPWTTRNLLCRDNGKLTRNDKCYRKLRSASLDTRDVRRVSAAVESRTQEVARSPSRDTRHDSDACNRWPLLTCAMRSHLGTITISVFWGMLIHIRIETKNEHSRIVTFVKMRSTLCCPRPSLARRISIEWALRSLRFNKSIYRYRWVPSNFRHANLIDECQDRIDRGYTY